MRAPVATEMHLEVPARSVYVGVVRLALATLARQAGLDEDRVDDLRIAVSEACANAVFSGEENGTSIAVTWREEDDKVVVEVVDAGAAGSPAAGADGADTDRLDMSVALMRSLVDECTFERRPEGGITTRLVLSLGGLGG